MMMWFWTLAHMDYSLLRRPPEKKENVGSVKLTVIL
jgi:hypothetical protein